MEQLRNENERVNRKKNLYLLHFNTKIEQDKASYAQKEMTYQQFQLEKKEAVFIKLKKQFLLWRLKRRKRLAALLRRRARINQEIIALAKELKLKKAIQDEGEAEKCQEKRGNRHLQNHFTKLTESLKFLITDALK
jgi:hypothetical protein